MTQRKPTGTNPMPGGGNARGGYVPPRIVTHSVEALRNATLSLNACTGFTRRRGEDDDSDGGGDGGVTY